MPLEKCSVTRNGKKESGWKYGDEGLCFTGPGAKKKAIKQGLAIQYNGGPKFEPSAKKGEDERRKKTEAELERMVAAQISDEESFADDLMRERIDRAMSLWDQDATQTN